ncbi:hypothetical protein FALCPG4_006307 [Fusarium falciforme]
MWVTAPLSPGIHYRPLLLLSSPVSSFLSLTARTNHPSLACSSVYFHIPTNIRFSPPQVRRPSTAASRRRGAASNQISYSQAINTPRVWVWRRATQAHAPQIAHQNPNKLNCRAVDHSEPRGISGIPTLEADQ